MNTRRRVVVVGGILIGAIVVARVMIALRPEPPRRPPEPETPLVTVQPAKRGDGPIPIHGAGTVRPRAETAVATEVAGKIVWVSRNMQSGAHVSSGELLVRIDESDYRNRVEQARADVAVQEVALLQAQEEVRLAIEEYEQFRSREARRGLDRSAPSPLTLRRPQLDAARAQLDRARAQLADAELALNRTEVRAPFDGRVRDETANIGAFVAAGQSIGRVYASDAVEVVVPITDDDALQIPGLWSLTAGDDDPAVPAVVVTEYDRRRFEWDGYVDRAETALDEQTRTIDVIVVVPDPFRSGRPRDSAAVASAPPLLVGAFANVEIQGGTPDYFVLPRRALRPGDEVWAVDDTGRVRIVRVEVLQEIDDRMYVLGDFRDGQPVVVAGVALATDGMLVRVADGGGGP